MFLVRCQQFFCCPNEVTNTIIYSFYIPFLIRRTKSVTHMLAEIRLTLAIIVNINPTKILAYIIFQTLSYNYKIIVLA